MVEMLAEAQKELLEYPYRNMAYRLKRTVKLLTGRRTEPNDRYNWPNGLLALGLLDCYAAYENGVRLEKAQAEDILTAVRTYCDRWIAEGCRMHYLDNAINGTALTALHRITGEDRYREAADKAAEYLLHHETDGAGSLPYRPAQHNGHIYADGIGMICPFLCEYGITYKDEEAVRLAVTQIRNFLALGMDKDTGLPYHGYRYENGVKYGIIGWTRGTGWLMLGMAHTLACLPESHSEREFIRKAFCALADRVSAYQADDGLFRWQLCAKEGPADTSGTAMILSAVAGAVRAGVIDDAHMSDVQRGKTALQGHIKGGKVYGAMGECQGFGMYPQVYGAYPWSLGPALSLFCAADAYR